MFASRRWTRRTLLPLLAAACASGLFGSALVATRWVVGQTDPASLALHRYLIAGLILSPLALRERRPPARDLLLIVLLGAIFYGLFPFALALGLRHSSSARAAVWIATAPALTLLLARAMGTEQLSIRKLLGISCALGGVALAELPGITLASHWGADVALMGAGLCTAVYNVFSPPLTKRYSARTVVGYGSLAGVATLLFLVLGEGRFILIPRYTAQGWGVVLYLGVVCSALAMSLWAWALAQATPTRIAVFLNLNPLTATILGGWLLGETVSRGTLLGLPLGLLGVTLVTWVRKGGERTSGMVFDTYGLRALAWLEAWDSRRQRSSPQTTSRQMKPGALAAGRYQLEALLGQGGMGKVWLALDTLEGRQVALKEMRAHGAAGEAEQAADVAFKREFYTMTKLQHPSTVKVFDYGRLQSGDRYITMEIVRGNDLKHLIEREPLSLERLYSVLSDMAQVLGFIHSRLYVHCDIKSENIRLTDKRVLKLMDFGLMHQLGTPSDGMLKGTPAYMAPEIARGGVIDQRTDLYSLGVLAFELATGRYPFTGRSLTELLSAHLNQPAPSIRTFRDVPPLLDRIVQKLMSKDPADRYAHAGKLLEELAPLLGGKPVESNYTARTSYLHCADLIGREGEQELLRGHLQKIQGAQGKSLFVSAPAGVGKTRLLQEFRLAVKLTDIPFFTGQCRVEGQAPLAPLVEALTQLLSLSSQESLARHGPQLARILPAVRRMGIQEAPLTDPASDKLALFAALRGWLKELTEQHAFILCMEDLHWADAGTLEFTNLLVRELDGRRAMVLGTFRSNEVDRLSALFQTVDEGLTQQLELPLLSPLATSQLTAAMLGKVGGQDALISRLHSATAGNAFFITETIRAWIESGALQLQNGIWHSRAQPEHMELPGSIEEVVVQRLGHLAPETLSFCRRVAPLGRKLDLREVKEVSHLEDERLFTLLDELVERQFIQKVEDDFLFTHDTVRNSIYGSMPESERIAAHREAALALERIHAGDLEQAAALLGYHFALGQQRTKAIGYLLKAAQLSRRTNLLLKTTEQLAQAVDLIEAGEYPRKTRTLIELWAQLVEIGMTAHPPSCVKYADKLFSVWEQRLDFGEAARTFHRKCARLARGPRFLTQRKLTRIWSEQPLRPDSRDPLRVIPKAFIYRSMQGVSLSSMGMDARVLALSDRMAADNPEPGPFRAAAYISKAIYLLHTGQFAEMARGARDTLTWYEAHLRTVGAMPRMLWRDYAWGHHFYILEQAMTGVPLDEEVWNRGYALAKEKRFGDTMWFLKASRGVSAALSADPASMQSNYDSLVDDMRQMGNPMMVESRLAIWMGMYWLQRLERDRADAVCTKMESWQLRLPHDNWLRRYALGHRALFVADHGSPGEAQQALDRAFAAVQEIPSFRLGVQLLAAQSRVALTRNEPGRARVAAEQAVAQARAAPTRCSWDDLVASRTLAESVGGTAGAQLAIEAVDAARKANQSFHEALALFTLARITVGSDRALAAQSLRAAEEKLEVLKCSAWLAELETFRQRASASRVRSAVS